MAGREPIDNSKIYELIDRTRLELKSDIIRLESKFDALEAGRLTRLEDRVQKQDISVSTAATKLAILGFIAASVVGAIIGVVVPRIVK
jgi:F0F1-type ATP synthase assembly protein I